MKAILPGDKNIFVSLYPYVDENGKNYFDSLTPIEQAKFIALFGHFLENKGI